MKTLLSSFMLIMLYATNGIACESEGPRRGYWFYKECAVEEAAEEDKYSLPPLPPQEALMKMHPQEISKILNERLEYAVYKMTPETVVDYYKVIDASRRKSLAFTALTEYVMLKNPELNAKSQSPLTVPARKATTRARNSEYAGYIAEHKAGFALVMFAKQGCQYCEVQEASLKHFQAKYGWKYKVIDVDLNPDIAIKFSVSVTPTTALIRKGSDEWMPVSVGAESVSSIEVGVYRALRMLNNEVSPAQFILDRYREGGFFDPQLEEGS